MVLTVSNVIVLTKVPVPVPSVVWLPLIKGFVVVPQQTPRAVTVEPPSELILPPLIAPVAVTELTGFVLRLGNIPAGPLGSTDALSSF